MTAHVVAAREDGPLQWCQCRTGAQKPREEVLEVVELYWELDSPKLKEARKSKDVSRSLSPLSGAFNPPEQHPNRSCAPNSPNIRACGRLRRLMANTFRYEDAVDGAMDARRS